MTRHIAPTVPPTAAGRPFGEEEEESRIFTAFSTLQMKIFQILILLNLI